MKQSLNEKQNRMLSCRYKDKEEENIIARAIKS